jgi:hypothetical protein
VAKRTPIQDKDLGLAEIRKNIAALASMAVKAGIVESEGTKKRKKEGESTETPTIAQYAAWNEYGVKGKKKMWRIPPRPFIRGWTDNKTENIKATQKRVAGKVIDGKWDADDAIMRLGEYAQDGIKTYIRTGTFTENHDITINGLRKKDGSYVLGKDGLPLIKGKGSDKPLIDTGTMRNSVRYEVVKK